MLLRFIYSPNVKMLCKKLLLLGSSWLCQSSASRVHSRTVATGSKTAKGYCHACFIHTICQLQRTQIHIFAERSLGLWVMKLYFLQLIRHSQQVSGQKLTSGPFYKLWVVLVAEWRVSRSSPLGGKCCTAYGSTAPRCLSSPWAHHGQTEPSTAAAPVWPF